MNKEIEAYPTSVKVKEFLGCKGAEYRRAGMSSPLNPYLFMIIKVI